MAEGDFMNGATVRRMTNRDPLGKEAPMAKRLRRLRALHCDQAATFATTVLGITPTRWNNFENGMPLSRAVAELLVQKIPGMTLDWLYHEKPNGMPYDLWKRLDESDISDNTTNRG